MLAFAVASLTACVDFDRPTAEELKARAQEPVVRAFGPQGGVLRGPGVVIDVPEGALEEDVDISVRLTADKPGAPWKGYSFIYEFEPAGLIFKKPVSIELSFKKAPADAHPTIYWSALEVVAAHDAGSPDGDVFEPLATTVVEKTASAQSTHFSRAFVAEAALRDASEPSAEVEIASEAGAP